MAYDGSLGAVNFRLARTGEENRPTFFVGQDVREPGQAGQIGSIEIDSLHHGFGPEIAVFDPRQYAQASGVWANEVGKLQAGGYFLSIANVGAAEANGFHFPSAFEYGGEAYFILPSKVVKVDNTLTSSTPITLSANQNFTGSSAWYIDRFYLGVENNFGIPVGYVTYTPGTGWSALLTTIVASHFFAHRDKLWRAKNYATAGAVVIDYTDSATPSVDTNWINLGRIDTGARCTGLFALGQRLLVFKSGGQILGFDENRRIVTLHETNHLFRTPDWGYGVAQWNGQILVPHENGLLAIDLDTLRAKDISISSLQGVTTNAIIDVAGVQRGVMPGALKSVGRQLFMGTRAPYPSLWTLQNYSDGLYWNRLQALGSVGHIRAIGTVRKASDSSVWLVTLSSTGDLAAINLPSGDTANQPATVQTLGEIYTSFYPGSGDAGLVTKQFLQVRGYAFGMGSLNDQWEVYAAVDQGSFFNLGTITTNGPFSLAFPSTLAFSAGRNVRLRFRWGTAVNYETRSGKAWPTIALPAWVDFEYQPSAMDFVRLIIDYSSSGAANIWEIYDGIRALRGTVQTLTMNDSAQAWTVFVEQVERTKIRILDGAGADREVVSVLVRRLA